MRDMVTWSDSWPVIKGLFNITSNALKYVHFIVEHAKNNNTIVIQFLLFVYAYSPGHY